MDTPNLTYIHKLSKGDETFEKKLIHVIKTEFPMEIEIYFKDLASREFKSAAQTVHKLKHKMSILSFEKGYFLASQHEENLNDGNDELGHEFAEALKIITNYLILI